MGGSDLDSEGAKFKGLCGWIFEYAQGELIYGYFSSLAKACFFAFFNFQFSMEICF